MKQIAIIDNYDSFTYNLVQYLEMAGAQCHVHLNDAVSLHELQQLQPAGLLISPGPGTPEQAGITPYAIRAFMGRIPIFGVCLGHQAIGQTFGATVIRATHLMHGKTSPIEHDGRGLFSCLPQAFHAARYHSLILDPTTIPDVLDVSAQTPTGEIMGIRHRWHSIEGVQFHPESFLTEHGPNLIQNWLTSL